MGLNYRKNHSAHERPKTANEKRRELEEIHAWLMKWPFTHFVTLTFSNPDAGSASLAGSKLKGLFLEDRLRTWDAHICRYLLGNKWQKRPDERPFWLAALEKPGHSPHYHCLMSFPETQRHELARTHLIFEECAERFWRKLVPTGTVHVDRIANQGDLAKYILKSFHADVEYDKLILPDQFSRWSTPGTAAAIGRHAKKASSPRI